MTHATTTRSSSRRPIIGIACGIAEQRMVVPATYTDAVVRAGGVPILLPPPEGGSIDLFEAARICHGLCDGLVLIGGEDPETERFGVPTHPMAVREPTRRQQFDEALLRAFSMLEPDKPVLGVCLGMQLMALVAGGALNQHLPDDVATHADHADDRRHLIDPTVSGSGLDRGTVTSKHHQAVRDAGAMRVIARAHDGVIEAIDDPERHFYLGVQWHPERTGEGQLGQMIFDRLIEAARIERVHALALD